MGASAVTGLDADSSAKSKLVTKNGFSFTIEEQVGPNKETIRKYTNTKSATQYSLNSTNNEDSEEEIDALLLALGMDQEVIDNIPDQTKQKYAVSEEIITTTSYIKEDQNGNIAYLTEEEATREAAVNNARASTTTTDTLTDTYMSLTHTVAHQGNGHYLFSTSGRWLTMPIIRGVDSLGSCAPELAIYNDTRFAWYSYYFEEDDYLLGTSTQKTELYYTTNFQNAITGDWYGSAVVFDLPDDYTSQYYHLRYSNYRMYYEYEADLRHPELITNFNSVGTYSHQTIVLSLDPSVSISYDGEVDASIGLSLSLGVEDRSVQLTINYIPD